MKRIKISKTTEGDQHSVWRRDKSHRIYFGERQVMSFTTKKDLNYALAEINRILNGILFDLNELWIQAFTEYRRMWFYLPEGDPVMGRESDFVDLNGSLRKTFSLISSRSHWINGNHFSFHYLINAIEDLQDYFEKLKAIKAEQNLWLQVKIIETRKRQLDFLAKELLSIDIPPKYAVKPSIKNQNDQ